MNKLKAKLKDMWDDIVYIYLVPDKDSDTSNGSIFVIVLFFLLEMLLIFSVFYFVVKLWLK